MRAGPVRKIDGNSLIENWKIMEAQLQWGLVEHIRSIKSRPVALRRVLLSLADIIPCKEFIL